MDSRPLHGGLIHTQDVFHKLLRGPIGLAPEDYPEWLEAVTALPRAQFLRIVQEVTKQLDPEEHERHARAAAHEAYALAALSEEQRTLVSEALLRALLERGLSQDGIARAVGIAAVEPGRTRHVDLVAFVVWTQRLHPEAFSQAVTELRLQPAIINALLGKSGLQLLGALMYGESLAQRAWET